MMGLCGMYMLQERLEINECCFKFFLILISFLGVGGLT